MSEPETLPEHDRDDAVRAAGSARVSALWAMEAKGSATPRVVLREPGGDAASAARAPSAGLSATKERYRILGTVSQGGMGSVLRGRDEDLGRDVAMKVILDRFASDPGVVRRFIEEAQIGGQLQHPGIVPVYELGMAKDGHPYFTMKLVKGKTLADLLREGRDDPRERRRILGVLEQVCHALAYAHARGVIHRDLKPSNVMVGAFGEVQVLDWGLAKVVTPGGVAPAGPPPAAPAEKTEIRTLRSGSEGPHSTPGMGIGTPAYMPPEQALGDVERMDARSDVFSLGAILCEVLTGLPPYPAESARAFLDAASGRLDDAYARLDRCDADPRLVRLARRCLEREPRDRPADAGVLAVEIAGHLAAAEERARAAELEAAEARVREAAARRERRLTLALSTSLLLLLLLGGGGYAWVERDRRARAGRVAEEVVRAQEEAILLRGQARGSGEADLSAWGRALAAAQRAAAVARSGEADAATRARAEGLSREVESEQERARAALAAAARDRRMLDTVAELRNRIIEDWDWQTTDAAYARAFRDYGIDVDALPAGEAAAKLRATRIAPRLAAAVDDWAVVRRRGGAGGEAGSRRLEEVAKAADGDPWRTRLREAADRSTLRALEESADLDSLPPETLDSLASAVGRAGDVAGAVRLLRRAQTLHPGDPWIHLRLAAWLDRLPDPPLDEEAGCYRAAIALRPSSYSVWSDLGAVLSDKGEAESAVAALRRSISLEPTYAVSHGNLGNALRKAGRLEEAVAACREAIRLAPGFVAAWQNLGLALQAKGELEEAVAALKEAVRIAPGDPGSRNDLGAVLRDLGDPDGAEARFREAIALRPEFAAAHANLAATLRAKGEAGAALAAARDAIRADPDFAGSRIVLGQVLLDAGEVDASILVLRDGIRLDPASAGAHLTLGNALDSAGDLRCAIAAYREAVRLKPGLAIAHGNLGRALRRAGDLEGAIAAHREAVRLDPSSAAAESNLGVALEASGDRDGAEAAFRRAIAIDPGYERASDNLGSLLVRNGNPEAAAEVFRELARRKPGLSAAHANLGLVLLDAGRCIEGLESLRKARDLGVNDPEALRRLERGLEEGERFAVLERKLLPLLAGEIRPADGAEAASIALLCRRRRLYAAAVDFYVAAFERDRGIGGDPERGLRYDAASAAALAAGGAGEGSQGLPEPAKAALRGRARDWLRADLAAWRGRPDSGGAQALEYLERARSDPGLAAIRESSAIPPAEAEECRALWAEVEEMLRRLGG